MIFKRSITKVITEKEYDDIDKNRIMNVEMTNKFSIFGLPIFIRKFNEQLVTVEGGEYKNKEKRIGFGK